MPEKIRTAVIPAAGLGTRFLPTTKAVPKELMPLLDQPLIQYGVEEAVGGGGRTPSESSRPPAKTPWNDISAPTRNWSGRLTEAPATLTAPVR